MKFKSELEQAIIATVQQEVVPALGCTEPVSLALAAAVARQYLGALPDRRIGSRLKYRRI
ncbi:hypothetical protein [Actinobacillus pleuropneumoniae]|uniref:hypothetical protein n=1 Tax=Actinobacillus pleuropneumoniae TaxID=715 RepID=UPI003B01D766